MFLWPICYPRPDILPLPYVMAYDMFPLTSLKEKKIFLEEAVAGDYILFFEHDPLYECCTFQKTEKGIRVKEFFSIKRSIVDLLNNNIYNFTLFTLTNPLA